MSNLGPRLVIAGTHSGVGKTTVATGLVAALRAGDHRPATAKVGPDFIDPGYHSLASGRPPRNLDPWLCGPEAIGPLAARAGHGGDVLVVEGVMGLFDGSADGRPSSTADVAALLDAPIVLVIDASAQSGSAGALVHGFGTFDRRLRVAGVVLNRVGSDAHEVQLREAIAVTRIPVVGALRRDDRFTWRDRHLGLVPVAERPDEVSRSIDVLAGAIQVGLDLDEILAIARTASTSNEAAVDLPDRGTPVRVAVAAGVAFTFTYQDTLDALEAGGAEVVPFDPRHDTALPEHVQGLVVGGGFPETFVDELADNRPLLDDVRERVDGGLVTWAECGGLLWLGADLDGRRLAGALPSSARMTDRLTLGYRWATTTVASPIGPASTTLTGHEFHYSRTDPAGDALVLSSRFGERTEGFASPTLIATYLHHHPGGDPSAVTAFLDRCRGVRPAVR